MKETTEVRPDRLILKLSLGALISMVVAVFACAVFLTEIRNQVHTFGSRLETIDNGFTELRTEVKGIREQMGKTDRSTAIIETILASQGKRDDTLEAKIQLLEAKIGSQEAEIRALRGR